jgi:predicted Zn-dependent protease
VKLSKDLLVVAPTKWLRSYLALIMFFAGNAEPGLPLIENARRLNPNQSYEFPRGLANFMMSNYSAAIELLKSNFEQQPNFIPSGLYLAASQALVGNQSQAEATVATILQVRPNFQLGIEFLRQIKKREDRTRFVNGLHQSGLLIEA